MENFEQSHKIIELIFLSMTTATLLRIDSKEQDSMCGQLGAYCNKPSDR